MTYLNNKIIRKLMIIISLVIFLNGILIINTYNSLEKQKKNINDKFEFIQISYEKKANLILKIIKTINNSNYNDKSNISFEIIKTKKNFINSNIPNKLIQNNFDLTNNFNHLFIIIKNDPKLKYNPQILKLINELNYTENKIKIKQKIYNEIVKKYNQRINSYPTKLIAKILRLKKKEIF